MKLFLGLILMCIAVSAYAAPRIVGGQDAPDGKYPYQVSLRTTSGHLCGGSILNKRWILTAAHCVVDRESTPLFVVVGTNKLSDENGVSYQSEYVVAHPGFSFSTLNNDIGLVRVDRDIEFNDKVQPIGLPVEDFSKDNYPAVLTGWGTTILNGETPDNLQEIALKVIGQEKCRQETQFPVNKSHICTLTKAGEGACHGDSGGPLVADGVQIGIVSFGSPCARGRPDIFTRVFTFRRWIKEQQNKF